MFSRITGISAAALAFDMGKGLPIVEAFAELDEEIKLKYQQ